AFAGLPEADRRLAQLWIAGDGPLAADLWHEAVGLGVSGRVKLLGVVEDAGKLYAASDAFVMPSLHEGLPLALLEAMASGLPVIAAGVGRVPEVIQHGSSGVLLDSYAVGVWTSALSDIVRNEDRRTALGSTARMAAKGLSRER